MRTHLNLTTLEARETPAFASFDATTGQLLVNVVEAPNRSAVFSVDGSNRVLINFNRTIVGAPGNSLSPQQVRSIVILGSANGDYIYLAEVAVRNRFTALDGRIAIFGNGGNDVVVGSEFADYATGGLGDDYIDGLGGNDQLLGDVGADIVIGNFGNDLLYGGDGNDYLLGADGNDILNGGRGRDIVDGGLRFDITYTGVTQDADFFVTGVEQRLQA